MRRISLIVCSGLLACWSLQASQLSTYLAEPQLKAKMADVYGKAAVKRAEAYARLLRPRAGTTDQQKIVLVNNYFNNLTYSEDPKLWGMDDYWANPLEFIGARGGIVRITALPSTTH